MKNVTMMKQTGLLSLIALVAMLFGLMALFMPSPAHAQTNSLVLPGSIGNTIYHDLNQNFMQDPGEGLSGVSVVLVGLNGTMTRTTVTDDNGNYMFTRLPYSEYTITVVRSTLPSTKQGAPNVSDPDGGTPGTSTTVLTQAKPVDFTQNFGYFGKPTQVGLVGSTAATSTGALVGAMLVMTLAGTAVFATRRHVA